MTPTLWVQVLVGCLGFLGTVAAAVIPRILHKPKSPKPPRPGNPPPSISRTAKPLAWNILMAACLALIGLDGVGFLLVIRPRPPTSTAELKVTIHYPKNGQSVEQTETIKGTAHNLSQGQELYLVLYSHTARRYYPRARLYPDSTGAWSVPDASFGAESLSSVHTFDIDVILPDKTAQATLDGYLNGADRSGLEVIPGDVRMCAHVTVTRPENR